VYTDLGSLHEEMVALRSSNMGKVRMGGLGALTGGLLPMTVTQIKQSHPKLTLSVLVDTSDILVQALHLDQLDFLVARIPQEYQWDDLEYEPLGEEIIQIAARASHPAIHADNLTLESLTRYPWVVHCRPTPLREIYHQVFREALVQAPLDIVESASTMLGVSLLLHTDMVTLMPKMLLDYYSSLGILARIPLELSAKLTPYGLIRRKNRPMTPAMQLVIDTLRENARLLQELNHPAPWQVEPATGLAALPG
jgi:DNA-binding transcriptional LysR family regulator